MSKESNSSAASAYENNPFYVAIQGIELLFNKAKSVGIFLAVLLGLSYFSSLPYMFVPPSTAPATVQETATDENGQVMTQTQVDEQEAQQFFNDVKAIPLQAWLLIALIVLVVISVALFISFFLQGILDYTSAELAAGKEVTFGEAVRGTFAKFWGFAWVMFLAGLKTFLWSLLFIIPGIIMAVRYSLAGTAYFAGKKGNDAIKHSLALTQGAWLTTNASQVLLPLITLGAAGSLFTPGTKAVLYRQLDAVTAKGEAKPAAHVLSWLVLLLPIAFVGLVLLLALVLIATFADKANF